MRAPTRVRYNRPKGTSTLPGTSRKRQSLIGNDMHSRASATAFKCATSIFLSGNEFRLQDASFRSVFTRQRKRRRAPALQRGTPGCAGRGRGKQRPYEGTKSRFPACGRQARRVAPPFAKHTQGSRAGGMTMAGVEVDEPRATQKPHVSSRKTRANGT